MSVPFVPLTVTILFGTNSFNLSASRRAATGATQTAGQTGGLTQLQRPTRLADAD